MTQEEKQLLLKDLCARLPYHPFFIGNKHDIMPLYNVNTYVGIIDCIPAEKIEDCRLYLRPMSSMTEEEKKELKADTCPEGTGYFDEKYLICPMSHYGEQISYDFMSVILEWLNSHHFDYRGLIGKGLALEAPEGMYK